MSTDASVDPLGVGPITGARIAATFASEPYDPEWSRIVWERLGHSPASIYFHYGSIDMLPEYHPVRRKQEGAY